MGIAPKQQQNQLDEYHRKLLNLFAYFAVFNYPLTISQVLRLAGNELKSKSALDYLLEQGVIQKHNGFFGFNIKPSWIEDRLEQEKMFEDVNGKVRKSILVMSKFPFVKGVALSGASSKGLMKPDGDVDFFIITKPNRLWLTRTLLILNKKVFRLNSRKYFCVNYFISSDNLEIPDRNWFTAMEIEFLSPVIGSEVFDEFDSRNDWTETFVHCREFRKTITPSPRKSFRKKTTEVILDNKLGDVLDKLCMRLTVRRWQKKFAHFSNSDFELTMRSRNDVSKHHPSNFQKHVLSSFENNLNELLEGLQ